VPKNVAVTSAFEAGLRRGTAFGLARATRRFDLLAEFDAIPFLPAPVDPVGRNIGIHNDAAPSLPGPDNNYPERSEARTDDDDRVP